MQANNKALKETQTMKILDYKEITKIDQELRVMNSAAISCPTVPLKFAEYCKDTKRAFDTDSRLNEEEKELDKFLEDIDKIDINNIKYIYEDINNFNVDKIYNINDGFTFSNDRFVLKDEKDKESLISRINQEIKTANIDDEYENKIKRLYAKIVSVLNKSIQVSMKTYQLNIQLDNALESSISQYITNAKKLIAESKENYRNNRANTLPIEDKYIQNNITGLKYQYGSDYLAASKPRNMKDLNIIKNDAIKNFNKVGGFAKDDGSINFSIPDAVTNDDVVSAAFEFQENPSKEKLDYLYTLYAKLHKLK